MLYELKDFFIYNKSERLGILILLLLIALVSGIYFLSPYFVKPAILNDLELIARIDSLLATDTLTEKQNHKTDSLFFFNPNETTIEEWMLLGLSKSQAEGIENYKKAGGKFYSKEDVKKMYTVSDAMFNKLEPYIKIEKHADKKRSPKNPDSKKNPPPKQKSKIEINTADSAQLTSLYGIGPVFASRITGYRKLLGGFYNTGQLLEVYGMDSIRLYGFINNISLDSSKIHKINPLSADFKEVLRHPYISYELTRFIFNNKKQIQNNGLEYLLEFEQMNDSLFQKITPYLSLD